MKKLLLACLLFASFQAAAQIRQSISLVGGPATFLPLSYGNGWITSQYYTNGGWEAGLDYHLGLNPRWELKAGVRYQESGITYKGIFDSEQYAPKTKPWLYALGTRLFISRLKAWRWYAEGELGFAQYKDFGANRHGVYHTTYRYVTAGLGLGLQWWPPEKQLGLFIQPLLRYLNSQQYWHAATLSLELGLRTQIFKGKSTDNG